MRKHLPLLALMLLAATADSHAAGNDGFRPLFNGTDLAGWKLRRPGAHPSWSVKDGLLINTVEPGDHGTDLLTEARPIFLQGDHGSVTFRNARVKDRPKDLK
jgi:hypothetical protein